MVHMRLRFVLGLAGAARRTIIKRVADFRWESLMRRTLHRLVLTSFAMHMVFGCCLHHVHAAALGAESVIAETPCPCEHHEGESGQPAPSRTPCRGCDGDRCVFTRATTSDAPEVSADPNGVASIRDLPTLLDLGRTEATDLPRGRVATPVRLHLLKQVLLL